MIPTTGEVIAVDLTDEELGIIQADFWKDRLVPETAKNDSNATLGANRAGDINA